MTTLKLNNPQLLKTQAYLNGCWHDDQHYGRIEVINPATQQLIATVPDLDTQIVNQVIIDANDAQAQWRHKTAKERALILRKWFDLIMQNQEDLAKIMTAEQGKPLQESRGEVAYGASFVEWFAEEGKRAYGDVIPSPSNDKRLVVIKQAIGVVAAITPWNFPIAMITRKCAPALAAGCAVVVKPSELTPLSALALAVLAESAGLPAGLFNVVTSQNAAAIGQLFSVSPLVRKLSFTGSTRVGKLLTSQCADTMKKVSMELGGNAPFIVFEDADIDAAVAGLMASKYRNAGQTCVCTNRILVQSNIYDRFVEKFHEQIKKLVVGNGMDEDVNQGPLINQAAVDKVQSHIDDAVFKGAKVIVGGHPKNNQSTFFEPTLLTEVTENMLVAKEETFGPLSAVFRFDSEEQAINMANNTDFGLAAYFYSRDIGRVWRVGEALEYGMVGINEGIISNEVAPFGGIKESGLGREGSYYGLDEFLEVKYLCMGGI